LKGFNNKIIKKNVCLAGKHAQGCEIEFVALKAVSGSLLSAAF
jgi:hypothetical protein